MGKNTKLIIEIVKKMDRNYNYIMGATGISKTQWKGCKHLITYIDCNKKSHIYVGAKTQVELIEKLKFVAFENEEEYQTWLKVLN